MPADRIPAVADAPRSVAEVYEDVDVAREYLDRRLLFSWQKLLHRRQVTLLSDAVRGAGAHGILEVAPGPARLAAEVEGVCSGVMVENSAAMIEIARARLAQSGRAHLWDVVQGDAFALADSLGDRQFSLAYTLRLIRHFRLPERERIYASIRDRLVAGGLFALDVVNAHVLGATERTEQTAEGELAVYDAAFSEQSFRDEMRANGFSVVRLHPVIRHFGLQSFVSYKLDDVAPSLTRRAVGILERVPSREPLEWLAVCART